MYLEEAMLEKKLPDIDLRIVVEMPNGIDFNEWLASHSECSRFVIILDVFTLLMV